MKSRTNKKEIHMPGLSAWPRSAETKETGLGESLSCRPRFRRHFCCHFRCHLRRRRFSQHFCCCHQLRRRLFCQCFRLCHHLRRRLFFSVFVSVIIFVVFIVIIVTIFIVVIFIVIVFIVTVVFIVCVCVCVRRRILDTVFMSSILIRVTLFQIEATVEMLETEQQWLCWTGSS